MHQKEHRLFKKGDPIWFLRTRVISDSHEKWAFAYSNALAGPLKDLSILALNIYKNEEHFTRAQSEGRAPLSQFMRVQGMLSQLNESAVRGVPLLPGDRCIWEDGSGMPSTLLVEPNAETDLKRLYGNFVTTHAYFKPRVLVLLPLTGEEDSSCIRGKMPTDGKQYAKLQAVVKDLLSCADKTGLCGTPEIGQRRKFAPRAVY